MSKRQVIMVLGVWTAILPFLGFFSGWDKAFVCISGLLIALLAFRIKPEAPAKADPRSASYAEHRSVPDPGKAADAQSTITNASNTSAA